MGGKLLDRVSWRIVGVYLWGSWRLWRLCEALCFLPSTSTQNSSLYSGIGGSEEHGVVRLTGWQRGSRIFRRYWLT